MGNIKLNVPGEHNVLNSLATAAIGFEMGLNIESIIKGLKSYDGVRRRFEIKGIENDIMVVDDYAHHPTEVSATLQAARNGWNRRIVAVFQPHLFSRTRDFMDEFALVLSKFDEVYLLDIYPAREVPIIGISGELIYNTAKSIGHKDVHYVPQIEDIQKCLDGLIKSNDMIITIGAGTIWRYGQSYFNHLKNQRISN